MNTHSALGDWGMGTTATVGPWRVKPVGRPTAGRRQVQGAEVRVHGIIRLPLRGPVKCYWICLFDNCLTFYHNKH